MRRRSDYGIDSFSFRPRSCSERRVADTELGDFCGPPARVPSDVTESAFSFSCQTLKLPGVHRMIRSGRKKNGTLVRAGDQNETPDGGRAGAAPAAPHPRAAPAPQTLQSLRPSRRAETLTLCNPNPNHQTRWPSRRAETSSRSVSHSKWRRGRRLAVTTRFGCRRHRGATGPGSGAV